MSFKLKLREFALIKLHSLITILALSKRFKSDRVWMRVLSDKNPSIFSTFQWISHCDTVLLKAQWIKVSSVQPKL